jgi:hypothetical protein
MITAAEVEARWRALQARAGRAVGEAVDQTEPLPLLLAGLGLAALAAARWLRRPSPAAVPADAPARQPGAEDAATNGTASVAVVETVCVPAARPDQVAEALVRGLVEGLVAGGVLPTGQRAAPAEGPDDA